MTQHLYRSRRVAMYVITGAVGIASLVSFAESYRGLYLWAHGHQVPGLFAATFPLMLDIFSLVGELALLIALTDKWPRRSRILPWATVAGGLAASIAGNIGHVTGHLWTVRATAAVPPIAAVATLAVGLGILKRVIPVAVNQPQPEREPVSELAIEQFTPDISEHHAQLADVSSDAARVRYAMGVIGTGSARNVADWLEENGHRVQIDNVRTVMSRVARANANVTELPARDGRAI